MLPPNVPGGMTACSLAPAGQTPIVPEERRDRDRDVVAQVREVAAREVEDPQVRVGEVVRQQPEAGQDRRPAPALRVQVEDLDRERVAGLRALDGDRAGERVDAVPVEPSDRVRPSTSGVIWLSLTSRVWTTTVSPLATVSTGSLSVSHVKWTWSVGK